MIDEKLTAHIAAQGLASEAVLAVAVSGGPDSMALCFALSRYAQNVADEGKQAPEILAITVDHGLRAEAAEEARQVGAWLKGWPHLRHEILTRTPEQAAGQSRIMEEARRDRYAMMATECVKSGARALFLAHHADDQAETFLFRLAKGSGLDGLCAMRVVRGCKAENDDAITLHRPLLTVPKDDILAYCAAHEIPHVEDPSNRNTDYARPRLRRSADILAEEGLSAKRLGVTAMRMERARQALDYYAQELLRTARLHTGGEQDNDTIQCFDMETIRTAPDEVRLRFLLKLLDYFRPEEDYAPRMEKCELLCARLFDEAGFRGATLGGVLFALKDKGRVLCASKEETSPR